MSAYLGNTHPRELHLQSVANDQSHSADLVSHSSQLATLETKDTELEATIPNRIHVTDVASYSYQTIYSDDQFSLIWTGNTIRYINKTSTRNVTIAIHKGNYYYSNTFNATQGTTQWLNGSYDDSSFYMTDGISELSFQDYDSNEWCYRVKILASYWSMHYEIYKLK